MCVCDVYGCVCAQKYMRHTYNILYTIWIWLKPLYKWRWKAASACVRAFAIVTSPIFVYVRILFMANGRMQASERGRLRDSMYRSTVAAVVVDFLLFVVFIFVSPNQTKKKQMHSGIISQQQQCNKSTLCNMYECVCVCEWVNACILVFVFNDFALYTH